MSKTHLTRSRFAHKSEKPAKPNPEFPLFPLATKHWAMKIRGQLCYFGSWADGPNAALAKSNEQKDARHAGNKPRDTELHRIVTMSVGVRSWEGSDAPVVGDPPPYGEPRAVRVPALP